MNMLTSLSFNRLINLLILSWLASAGAVDGFSVICCPGGFCIPTNPIEEAGGMQSFGEVGVTILDLSFPGLPFEPDPDDADPKDMSVVKSGYFSDAVGKKIKRLLMRAKKDGAYHQLTYGREFSDSFDSGILIEVDPSKGGLVDGQSAGYFEISQFADVGEGVPLSLRVTATWDDASQGLSVSAEDQAGPLGMPVIFAGVTEIALHMFWDEKGRFLSANPGGDFEEGVFFNFNDAVPIPGGVPFSMSFGAHDLDKGAQMFFRNLFIRSENMIAGGDEVPAAMNAAVALSYIETAWVNAQLGSDPALVNFYLDIGLFFLEAAEDALADAMSKGTIHESAEVKLADRSITKGMKRLNKSSKLAAKLEKKDKSSNKALANRANKARWAALLIQAQLFGFKSKSIDKYFATLIVETPNFF